jgi:hypothetical protein
MKAERIFRKKFTLAFAQAEQEKAEQFALEGECQKAFVRMPNFASAVTGAVSLLDEEDFEVVASGSLAKNQDHKVDAAWPLPGLQKVKVRLSAALGAGDGGNVIVVLYGRKMGI